MHFWKSVSTCTSANYIATSAEVSPNWCFKGIAPNVLSSGSGAKYTYILYIDISFAQMYGMLIISTGNVSPNTWLFTCESQVAYCTCIVPTEIPRSFGVAVNARGWFLCVSCRMTCWWQVLSPQVFLLKGGQFRCWLLWVSLRNRWTTMLSTMVLLPIQYFLPKGYFPPIPKICNHHSSLRVPFQCPPWK